MHSLWGVLSYLHCLCFRMDGLKRFEYAKCGRVFLWKRRKKISVVFKQKRIRVDRARVSNANDFENIKNYAKKGVNILNQVKSTF